jgi:cysteine desulfurase/selenocysteine lyase
MDAVYASTARLVNASSPDEIALVDNSTRAFDLALFALPFEPGDVILTSMAEYHSNYIAYLQLVTRGVTIEVLPRDDSGQSDVAALRKRLGRGGVRAVCIPHMPTNGGLVEPAAEVGQAVNEAGVFYLLDATQTLGQMPLDVRAIGCHALAGTSRKYLRGPRGVGFLWVAGEWLERLEPPMVDGHAAAWMGPEGYVLEKSGKRFETWETFVAGRLAFGAAVDYALSVGLPRIWERVSGLAAALRRTLAAVPGVILRDLGAVRGGIVSFTIEGRAADEVKLALRARRINVTVSRARSTLLDMQARGLPEVVRASVHYYNTEDELDRFAIEIARLAGQGNASRPWERVR